MATAVVVGTVIGSGVFRKPQVVAENTPNFGVAATIWVAVGLLALLGALALAEVAVLFPRAGGNYVFLREGYGRLAGFLFGWVEFWIIRSASLAALATIFTESLHDVLRETVGAAKGSEVLGYWEQRGMTVAVILGLAVVNVRGVRWGGGLQFIITTVKVGSLIAIAVLPFVVVALGRTIPAPDEASIRATATSPPQALEFGLLFNAVLGVLWAYHGWMNIAPVAEEVRNPQRNIPISLLAGVGIVMILYLSANWAYADVLSWKEIAAVPQGTPTATVFSERLLGPVGTLVISAAIMTSVFGALNGNLLVGPRLLYAMGEDGLAPRSLGAVHPRYRTPARAILVMALWSTLLVVGVAVILRLDETQFLPRRIVPKGKDPFDVLTDFAMFGAVIFETLAVTTIFVFRRQMPNADRPYRCPGYPVVPALYLILPALILANMFMNQQLEALTGLGFIGIGGVVYYAMLRRGDPAKTV